MIEVADCWCHQRERERLELEDDEFDYVGLFCWMFNQSNITFIFRTYLTHCGHNLLTFVSDSGLTDRRPSGTKKQALISPSRP